MDVQAQLSCDFAIEPLDDATGDDGAALRDRARRDGYLFLPGLLAPDAVLALRERVLEACERRGWLAPGSARRDAIVAPGLRLGAYDDEWTGLQQEVLADPLYKSLGEQPALLTALDTLYGEPARTGIGGVCRLFSPAASDLTTQPHQDHHYIKGSLAKWTAWAPLGDCPRALGGLAVLRGSAAAGPRPHRDGDAGADVIEHGAWATADFRMGDAVLFNCLTLHRALPNRTADRLRLSADWRYQPNSHPFP